MSFFGELSIKIDRLLSRWQRLISMLIFWHGLQEPPVSHVGLNLRFVWVVIVGWLVQNSYSWLETYDLIRVQIRETSVAFRANLLPVVANKQTTY